MKSLLPLVVILGVLLLAGLILQHDRTAELQSGLLKIRQDRDELRGEVRKLQGRMADLQATVATASPRSTEVKPPPQSPPPPAPAAEPVETPGVTITAPEGWSLNGRDAAKYIAGVDTTQTWGGMPSAYVKSAGATQDNFGGLMQKIAADNYVGKRVRLNAWVKTEEANDGGGRLWLRVDGQERGNVLGFDNMDNRPVKGSHDWQEVSVVLDVPPKSTALAYGFFVQGAGKMWVSGQTLQEVDATVPATNLLKPPPPLPKLPTNLGFNPNRSK